MMIINFLFVSLKKIKTMKKIIFICMFFVIGVINLSASPNPIVRRLSYEEIVQSRTPSAVAYNYIMAILAEDYHKMLSYMSDEGKVLLGNLLCEAEKEIGVQSYHDLYSLEGTKYDILSWVNYLQRGYEIAILYIQDEGIYEGKECIRVYIHCVPSDEINERGFQDITRCNNANPKVILTKEVGEWKVLGFK